MKITIKEMQALMYAYLQFKQVPHEEWDYILNIKPSSRHHYTAYRAAFIKYFTENYENNTGNLAELFLLSTQSIRRLQQQKFETFRFEYEDFCHFNNINNPLSKEELNQINEQDSLRLKLFFATKAIKDLRLEIENLEAKHKKERMELKHELMRVRREMPIQSSAINDEIILAFQRENATLKAKINKREMNIDDYGNEVRYSYDYAYKIIHNVCVAHNLEITMIVGKTKTKMNSMLRWRYAFYHLFLRDYTWIQVDVAKIFEVERSTLSSFLKNVPKSFYEKEYEDVILTTYKKGISE